MSSIPRVQFIFEGKTYKWCGWYGCQLESLEWRTVPAGTQRVLDFGAGNGLVTLTVFSTKREGLKVRTTWAVSNRGSLDEHVARINDLRQLLKSLI